MRRLAIISLLVVLVSCGALKDALRPDIPLEIYETQQKANQAAALVLGSLRTWVRDPATIPGTAITDHRLGVALTVRFLKDVRDWMITEKVDEKVTKTVIDLIVAWEDYIDVYFFAGEEAWLKTQKPMTGEEESTWLQVFTKIESLHQKIQRWMDEKGVIDE